MLASSFSLQARACSGGTKASRERRRRHQRGRVAVVDLPSAASADPSFEGKLVLAFGRAETKAGVKDPVFPSVAVKGLALRCSVEFYHTVEHDESDGVKKDAKRPVQAASTPASGCPVPRLGASPTAPATTWFS